MHRRNTAGWFMLALLSVCCVRAAPVVHSDVVPSCYPAKRTGFSACNASSTVAVWDAFLLERQFTPDDGSLAPPAAFFTVRVAVGHGYRLCPLDVHQYFAKHMFCTWITPLTISGPLLPFNSTNC